LADNFYHVLDLLKCFFCDRWSIWLPRIPWENEGKGGTC